MIPAQPTGRPTKIENNSEFNTPEFVYLNFDNPKNLLMLPTLKPDTKENDIPQNVSQEKSSTGISLVFENKGKFKQRKLSNLELLKKIAGIVDTTIIQNVSALPNLDTYGKDVIKQFIVAMTDGADKQAQVSDYIERTLKESGQLIADGKVKTKLVGAYIKGELVKVEDFPTLLERNDFQSMSETLGMISGVPVGEFLYRAVRNEEYEKIKRNKNWFVIEATNFEDERMYSNSSSQVKMFSQDPDYSGKIIRFRTTGNLYLKAQDRISSAVPHLVSEIEILEDGNWIPV